MRHQDFHLEYDLRLYALDGSQGQCSFILVAIISRSAGDLMPICQPLSFSLTSYRFESDYIRRFRRTYVNRFGLSTLKCRRDPSRWFCIGLSAQSMILRNVGIEPTPPMRICPSDYRRVIISCRRPFTSSGNIRYDFTNRGNNT